MIKSAGILVYRMRPAGPEVFLVHPGGPFWKNKDTGAWSIPKGEYSDNEDPLEAARREFAEETGQLIDGDFKPLTPRKQKSAKLISAWAVEGEVDADSLKSNLFALEWPPHSGRMQQFPEVDRGGWFEVDEAMKKIVPGQIGFISELAEILGGDTR
jgi:predicted NUDIX family NTP pyrophosphohydrolase